MAFGAIIIGDEILRGKRQDKHFGKLIELLGARGLKLAWAEHVGDDPARITATLKRTLAGSDIVFSFGGIGATPDDHTRQCAADAQGVPIALHPEGEALIRARFKDEVTPFRLKMCEFPVGSSVIPNPYNQIPGFSIADHHFVPGFPVMAWPMVEWVLDTRYRNLHHGVAESEASIRVFGSAESTLTPLMERIESRYGKLKVFSLPSIGEDGARRHIELGVRGEPGEVAAAIDDVKAGVTETGATWEEIREESPRAR
jgi:molybdopterin-biosynthesis enzyme MoeA-like protein